MHSFLVLIFLSQETTDSCNLKTHLNPQQPSHGCQEINGGKEVRKEDLLLTFAGFSTNSPNEGNLP